MSILLPLEERRQGYSRNTADVSASLRDYSTKIETLNTEGRWPRLLAGAVEHRTDLNNNQIYQYDCNGDFNKAVLNRMNLPEFY